MYLHVANTLLENDRNPGSVGDPKLVQKWKPIYDIENFVSDGFSKVCEVDPTSGPDKWFYYKINKDLMYSNHCSWVYFIVLGTYVVKVGETGNPLGIGENYLYGNRPMQPAANSKSRLGRLRSLDGTDSWIRQALKPYLAENYPVSIWAKKCPLALVEQRLRGNDKKIVSTIHKEMELAYLDYFCTRSGYYPDCNKGRK
jgi:hypothetical protein